jgi:hypothetical protein
VIGAALQDSAAASSAEAAAAEAAAADDVVAAAAAAADAVAQETVASTVPSRVGPPDSSYHMKLGYTAAFVIFGAYIVVLLRRVAAVRRAR